MKKPDLGQTITILANLGVIAGIVFLGVEIQNSTTQAQIATAQEMVAQRTEWRELLASDEVLADIYLRGLKGYTQLTPLEQERFDLLMRSFLHKLSVSIAARSANLIGPLPDPNRRVIEGELLRLLDEPGYREWWEQVDRRAIGDDVGTLTDELATFRVSGDDSDG